MSGRNTLQSREKKKRAEDFYLSDVWLLRVVSSAWCYINLFFFFFSFRVLLLFCLYFSSFINEVQYDGAVGYKFVRTTRG